ncbi:hypothetical protein COLO4_26423 [Corchorus olitorius]|uniref:TF-B3 domain-containing protein n=1 Tax=Corchorus olitorius TaxID=93759 RepID=A0A1R3HX66_9ROSI|nr:hypothetical protein COLO4_26423 [Corchorus olitorius]
MMESKQKWQEDMYWNCFKRQEFFASLSGDFHEQLAIPKKFASKLRNKLPETATLKGPGPSELTWSVELTRNGDALFFSNGWSEFVKDHSLEQNDLLIFRFNGESSFKVRVYDPFNGTEKESLYFPEGSSDAAGPSDAQGQLKRKDKAKFVVVKSSSEEEDEGNASQAENSENEDSYHKTPSDKLASDGDDDDSYDAPPSSRCATFLIHPKKNARLTSIHTEPVQNRGTTKAKSRRRRGFQIVSKRRPVTAKEKFDTLKAASAATSFDSYMAVMKPSMVYYNFRVGIPSDWVTKHLSYEIRDVILRLKDKEETWTVGFSLGDSDRGFLSRNWKNFVIENGLEEDDVCVFNPGGRSHDQKFIIDISIFRVVEK